MVFLLLNNVLCPNSTNSVSCDVLFLLMNASDSSCFQYSRRTQISHDLITTSPFYFSDEKISFHGFFSVHTVHVVFNAEYWVKCDGLYCLPTQISSIGGISTILSPLNLKANISKILAHTLLQSLTCSPCKGFSSNTAWQHHIKNASILCIARYKTPAQQKSAFGVPA